MKCSVLLTSGTQICIQCIGLLTGILVARWLGPEGRGQLGAVIGWAAMITYLGNIGLPTAYVYGSAREPWRRHQLLGNGVLISGVQWLILALIGWWVLSIALASQGVLIVNIARLYLLAYLPLNLLTLYLNAIEQGAGHYAKYNAVRLCIPVSYALLLACLWGTHHLTLRGVILANILSNVLTLGLACGLTLPDLTRRGRRSQVAWFDLRKLMADARYGLSAHIGTLQPFSGLRLDVLVLSILVPAHELGLYMVALAAASVLRAQGSALGQVTLSEVARCSIRQEQIRMIWRSVVMAAVGGAIAWLIVWLWATPLLRLIYGEPFMPAGSTLKMLVFSGVLGVIYRVAADGLRGMGYPLISTVAEVVSLLVGLIGLIILVPDHGIYGAAIAVALSSTASLLALIALAYRLPISTLSSPRQI